jgi:transposase
MEIASADTRRRALSAYQQGGKSQSEIVALFGVTLHTFQRWWRAWRTEVRTQLDGRLRPVLRQQDFDDFDLDRAFKRIVDMATAIISP